MEIEFKKYQHIERLGTPETQGIENGMCYVFPKIDGTNGQLWWNNGLMAGSRNRILSADSDNQGFFAWATQQENIMAFFSKYPTLKLFGEWLVPHTLRTYEESAWRRFYVFDVVDLADEDYYLPYEKYKVILDYFGIEYIPPICKVENPTYERLVNQLEKNGYLIKDGQGVGEGIVIKNYDYKNKFGRRTWAKIVRNEFKAKHAKSDVTELKEKLCVEDIIVDKYITLSFAEKEMAKIVNEEGEWSSKLIPRLINTAFYCLVKEECWNFVKENKYPTIDFKKLSFLTTNKIKALLPNIF